jgi:DHA1 family multidrug resistance protein-like MFS transporter
MASVDTRVKEMGTYGVAWASGFLIGPTIGGAIIQSLGYSILFLIATALISLALLPTCFWLIPEYRRSNPVAVAFSGNLTIMRRLLPWYAMTSCYGTIFGVIVAILPGYANSVNIVPAMIGSLFTAFGISRILSFSMSERHLRFGEKKALSIVSAVLVVSLGVLAAFPSYIAFLVSMIMIGGCFGVIFPITISLISRHFPQERLGAAVGSYEAMFAVGFTVGPLFGGAIAAVNVSLAFFATSFFALAMLFFIRIGHAHAEAAAGAPQNAEIE